MKYKVIENFIDKKTCEELIDHSRNIILNNNVDVININRSLLLLQVNYFQNSWRHQKIGKSFIKKLTLKNF